MTDPQPKPALSFAASMVLGGILVMALGQVYVRFTPPMYQAGALVSLHRWTQSAEAINSGEEKLAAEECPVAASGDNLRRVVRDLGLREAWAKKNNSGAPFTEEAAVAALRQKVSVQARPVSLSFEIRVVSDNREEPAKIANELAAIYTQYRSNQVNELDSARVSAYSKQSQEQSKKIADAKLRADELFLQVSRERATNQNVYYDPEAYQYLQRSRVSLESEAESKQGQIAEFRRMNANDLIQVLSTTETNDLLNGLLLEASHAKSALAGARQDHGPDSPEVKRAAAERDRLNGQIDHQVQVILAHKEADLASTRSAIENISRKLKSASTNSIESSQRYAEYQTAREEVTRLENGQTILAEISTNSMRAKVEPFILNYIPIVIQPAETPAKSFVPDPKFGRWSLLAGGIAILAGLLSRLLRGTAKFPRRQDPETPLKHLRQ